MQLMVPTRTSDLEVIEIVHICPATTYAIQKGNWSFRPLAVSITYFLNTIYLTF